VAGEAKRLSKYSPAGPDTGGSFARPNRGCLIVLQVQDKIKKGDKAYGKKDVGNQREHILMKGLRIYGANNCRTRQVK
jgi:hypothetical protein